MEFIRKNKSIIIAISIILIVNIGLIFGLAKPFYNKVQKQKDVVEQEKYKLNDIKEEGQRWQEYRLQREKFEANKDLLENSLVGADSQIDLIERLEQIAVEEDIIIDIQNLDAIKENKKKNSNEEEKSIDENAVIFSLNLDGEYNELLDYIYKLENLNYVLDISSVNIKARSAIPTLRDQIKEEGSDKSLQAKIIISFIPQL